MNSSRCVIHRLLTEEDRPGEGKENLLIPGRPPSAQACGEQLRLLAVHRGSHGQSSFPGTQRRTSQSELSESLIGWPGDNNDRQFLLSICYCFGPFSPSLFETHILFLSTLQFICLGSLSWQVRDDFVLTSVLSCCC